MLTVPADAVRHLFTPEVPGPQIHGHVAHSGRGGCRADRGRDPRVALAELPGDNLALRGDPSALAPGDLDGVAGLVEAPQEWLPVLHALDPGTHVWDRVVAVLPADVALPDPGARLLTPDDAAGLAGLDPGCAWIHDTWGGVSGLLDSGAARAVVVDGRPVSIAVPFSVGARYEDIGVVTEAEHRGRGLSTACAAAVAADIRARGRVPTWTTSPDNTASLAVAARLGFRHVRDDVLYAFRVPIPA